MPYSYRDRYRCEYRLSWPYGQPCHTWILIGAIGALHLHVTDRGKGAEPTFGDSTGDRFYGGIEIHYRQPTGHMRLKPPSHDHCGVLNAPCWHDGSSLRATEYWIPLWLEEPHDHARLFSALAVEADQRFFGTTEFEEDVD